MSILKQGSTGPGVKDLQQRLKDLGFDPKGIDGQFGPGTKAAVVAFQQTKLLQVDGIVGPATMAALHATGMETATGGGSISSRARTTAPALNLSGLVGKVTQGVIDQIPKAAAKFGITTNLRLAHFLAQCAVESMNFTVTVENLNYSAQRLLQVFPKYFKNVDVNAYARNPQKIGSRVYANRMGNGDEASGDGFKYRGRGYIQLTGKNNYQAFTNHIGEDCVANPDLVATKYPLASAGFFFNSNNIWAICDQGASDAVVTNVTKRVNGGTHGLSERIQYFKKFNQALS
ncbi:MAG TPA: peptidoglycan-binding protein [Pyrinomonadaceae bacterium]|jgi:putative chitinase|nr:peptidoglycan-binding protein [Pyrinomonadaceae bacterium]